MQKLPILKPGDSVEIIAPASRSTDAQLQQLEELLGSWGLNCIVPSDIYGKDLLCANTDEIRLQHLINALQNPTTKAVICARGGYGCMRLIPKLADIAPSTMPKMFIGMSDITALNLYLQQQWHWPVIHGALAQDKFSAESIECLRALMFGETTKVEFVGTPLNSHAQNRNVLESSVTGGNLCLIQAGIGTIWQLQGQHKIIFIEEVGERGYKVDRMLEHLQQAKIFNDATAIVFGDFIQGQEPDGSSLVEPVLARFAEGCIIPVVKISGIGHANTNFPMPLGTPATLQLGNEIKLSCSI